MARIGFQPCPCLACIQNADCWNCPTPLRRRRSSQLRSVGFSETQVAARPRGNDRSSIRTASPKRSDGTVALPDRVLLELIGNAEVFDAGSHPHDPDDPVRKAIALERVQQGNGVAEAAKNMPAEGVRPAEQRVLVHHAGAPHVRTVRLKPQLREADADPAGPADDHVRTQKFPLDAMVGDRAGARQAAAAHLDQVQLKLSFRDPEIVEPHAPPPYTRPEPEMIPGEPLAALEIRFRRESRRREDLAPDALIPRPCGNVGDGPGDPNRAAEDLFVGMTAAHIQHRLKPGVVDAHVIVEDSEDLAAGFGHAAIEGVALANHRLADECDWDAPAERRCHAFGIVVAAVVHDNDLDRDSAAIRRGERFQRRTERVRTVARADDHGHVRPRRLAHAVAPASTVITVPVTFLLCGPIRYATAFATSSTPTRRCSALRRTTWSRRSPSRPWVISVSTKPGAIALTLTPSRPTSRASERVNPTSEALLAAYTDRPLYPVKATIDATLTTRPPPSAIM